MNDQQILREKISLIIRDYRKANRLSQGQMAIKIGVKQRTEAAYEEKRSTPPYVVMKKISALINISVDDLINTAQIH